MSEFLFYEEEATKEEKSNYINLKVQIRESLKDKFNRTVLSEVLLDLQKDVSGDTRQRLFKLYRDLGLHLDAFERLKSWRWEMVSSGILELTQMQVAESYTFITKFVNDKRSVIRKQAEIATVTLKNEGINYFLDTTKYTISEWQQLKLLDVLRNLEDFQPPKFKVWLTSKNKDVVLFALRLIKYYNQNDANTSIIHLIGHKNNQIKAETIHCIKEFCVFEALDTLKKVFRKCNTDIKLLILDTIASLGDEKEIPFLQQVEKKEANFLVKSKALNAINTIAPESVMPTDNIEELSTAPMDTTNLPEKGEEPQGNLQNEIQDTPSKEVMDDIIDEFDIWPSETEDVGETLDIAFLPIVSETDHIPIKEENQIDSEEPIEKTSVTEKEDSLKGTLMEDESLEPALMNFLHAIVETAEEMDSSKNETVKDSDGTDNLNDQISEASEIKEENNDLDKVEEELLAFELPLEHGNEPEADDIATDEVKELTKSVFDQDYFNQDEYNKILLLDTIEQFGDQREIPLLISIVENESNERIKESAFVILNKVSDKKYWFTEDRKGVIENAQCRDESIFRRLFWQGDEESRLLLLDEILELGGQKEICFLETLMDCPDNNIRKKAKSILSTLQERLKEEEEQNETLKETENAEGNFLETILEEPVSTQTGKSGLGSEVSEDQEGTFKTYTGVMPLEFCFLLDELKIKPPKPTSIFDVEFEFTDTLQQGALKKNKENQERISDKEASFFKQLLSPPNTPRDHLNG